MTERIFTLHVFVPLWKGKTTLKQINVDKSNIGMLKIQIELLMGIASHLQRIGYNDSLDLLNDTPLNSLDLVNYATFTVMFFEEWINLFRSLASQDLDGLKKCRVLHKPGDTSCNEDFIATVSERQNVGTFFAASNGDVTFLSKLLDLGFNVNGPLKSGFGTIHTAIARGMYQCIDFLLDKGAKFDLKSPCGVLAMKMSKLYEHKQTERYVCFNNWRQRKMKEKPGPKKSSPLMMHQQFDSGNPTWLTGKYGTKYLCSTLPPLEFSGSSLSAKPVSAKGRSVTPAESAKSIRWLKKSKPSKPVDTDFEFKEEDIRESTVKFDLDEVKEEPADETYSKPWLQNANQSGDLETAEELTTQNTIVTWDINGRMTNQVVTRKISKFSIFTRDPEYEETILRKYFPRL